MISGRALRRYFAAIITANLVALFAVPVGIAYIIFSERLNIVIGAAWAYSDLMPVVSIIDAELSPLLQWTVIPLAAFLWAERPFRTEE